MAWLSDYPWENEYLFIQQQSQHTVGLTMDNIFVTESGVECKDIFLALEALNGWIHDTHGPSMWRDTAADIQSLACAIECVTETNMPSIQCNYVRSMIQSFFEKHTKCKINLYSICNQVIKGVSDLLLHERDEWIKIGFLLSLFPNLEFIEINGAVLKPFVFDDILKTLKRIGRRRDIILQIDFKEEDENRCYKKRKKKPDSRTQDRRRASKQAREQQWHILDGHKPESTVSEGWI
eukprot:873261_1